MSQDQQTQTFTITHEVTHMNEVTRDWKLPLCGMSAVQVSSMRRMT